MPLLFGCAKDHGKSQAKFSLDLKNKQQLIDKKKPFTQKMDTVNTADSIFTSPPQARVPYPPVPDEPVKPAPENP